MEMKSWFYDIPWKEVKKAAAKFDLDPELVGAIVKTESGGNTWAVRYEPGWRYHFDLEEFAKQSGLSYDTEKACQSMSWGLMQVMGTCLRELGFFGPLTEACVPKIGLHFGCAYLIKKIKKYDKMEDAIAAYNAGSSRIDESGKYQNQGYVNKVMKALKELREQNGNI